jgi:hypothetical protein
MAYIGTDINYGNIAKQTGTGDGSDTTPIAALTYTVPSNESILVFLDGVAQVPGTDFTATGTTLTFTTAPALGVAILVMFLGRSLDIGTPGDGTVSLAKMAVNSIDSDQYVDASIDNAHLADDAVGVAELSATGTASSSTFLRGDNAWAAPAGGIWTLIGSDLMSGVASVTRTGLSTTYDAYCLIWSDCTASGDGSRHQIRFGDSSGVDSGASDYSYSVDQKLTGASAVSISYSTGATHIAVTPQGVGNATGESSSGIMWVLYPGDSTGRVLCNYQTSFMGTTNVSRGGTGNGERLLNGFAIDRVDFSISSGTMNGRFTVWGIAHA